MTKVARPRTGGDDADSQRSTTLSNTSRLPGVGHAVPSSEQMPALFVRLQTKQADALARAAFERRAHKRELVCALSGRYVDPYSEEGLQALRELLADPRRRAG